MTEKLFDVTALGEILIDFTEWGFSDDGARLFAQNPGGAVANVAAAVARLGGRAAFVGKVGADMHGAFLRQTLREAGVDVSGVATDAERFTTLAFVKLAENGERSFSFARHDAADTNLRWEEVPQTLLTDTRVLSVGTLGMTDEPMRTTQLRCIETAKAAGAYIAVDPNYRATLWRSEKDFLRQTERLLEQADYVKLSDEETALVTGCADPEKALETLERRGVRTAVVTLGKDGAMALSGGQLVRAAGVPAVAVDATGAGDAFWGGFLYRLLHQGYPMEVQTAEMLKDCLSFGNRVGAYCVGHLGAISGMPTMAQLETME